MYSAATNQGDLPSRRRSPIPVLPGPAQSNLVGRDQRATTKPSLHTGILGVVLVLLQTSNADAQYDKLAIELN